MEPLYHDRREAGRALARLVERREEPVDAVVLALPRGGVPVAFEVARRLDAPLDIMPVRKLGTPGHEELAMGAIAGEDTMVLNPEVTALLPPGDPAVERVARAEWRELRRRAGLYREGRPAADLEGRTALLVDDGLATGATMHAAAIAARRGGAARVVVAVPVGPPGAADRFAAVADAVVCAATPAPFGAVGRWYAEFEATSDEEVRRLMSIAPPGGR